MSHILRAAPLLLRGGSARCAARLLSSSPDFAAFERAVAARSSCRAFAPTPVPPALLSRLLRLCLRSPSSFNTVPYSVVVASSAASREALAASCVGGNGAAVRSAPVVAVFAADLEPRRLLAATLARERSAGLTPAR